MSTTQPWWKRFLGVAGTPRHPTVGVVRIGSNLELCQTNDQRRGVRLITVTTEQLMRLDRIQQEHKAAQAELKALPKSRRARKRKLKLKIIPLPPNPQNKSKEAIG